jgi:hypothetical protein
MMSKAQIQLSIVPRLWAQGAEQTGNSHAVSLLEIAGYRYLALAGTVRSASEPDSKREVG